MQTLIGVDFSGAKNPAFTMWISVGEVMNNKLVILDCFPAADLDQPDRESCYDAILEAIKHWSPCVVGFDFPFSIPKFLMNKVSATWYDFVMNFPELFPDEHSFRKWCRENSTKELKIVTDRLLKTPFSPYNLRLFRQTYFGIKHIIHPIVKNKIGIVIPMQTDDNDVKIIEICPACTLKNLGLYLPYKGKTVSHSNNRINILDSLGISNIAEHMKRLILDNSGGDALDSIVAVKAVYNYVNKKPKWFEFIDQNEMTEGKVYI